MADDFQPTPANEDLVDDIRKEVGVFKKERLIQFLHGEPNADGVTPMDEYYFTYRKELQVIYGPHNTRQKFYQALQRRLEEISGDGPLDRLEVAIGYSFSKSGITKLLVGDIGEHGRRQDHPTLDAFWKLHKKEIRRAYKGAARGSRRNRKLILSKREFKADLEERLKQYDEAVALRDLEESIRNREDTRIAERQAGTRGSISAVLPSATSDILENLRGARKKDIVDGNELVNHEVLGSYRDLIRGEIDTQLAEIANLERELSGTGRRHHIPEAPEAVADNLRIRLNEQYTSAMNLFDYLIKLLDLNDEEKKGLRLHLVRRFKTEPGKNANLDEGIQFIKELYRDIQSALGNRKNPLESSRAIANRYYEQYKAQEDGNLMAYQEVTELTPEEIEEMRQMGDANEREGGTFVHHLNLHLAELDIAQLRYGVETDHLSDAQKTSMHNIMVRFKENAPDEEMLAEQLRSEFHVNPYQVRLQWNLIEQHSSELRKLTREFRDQRDTPEHLVEKISPRDIDKATKKEVKRAIAAEIIINPGKGRPDDLDMELQKLLRKMKTKKDVDEYLQAAKERARTYLVANEYTPEGLERTEKNDAAFDLFEAVVATQRYQNREKVHPKDDRFFVDPELAAIRKRIQVMRENAQSTSVDGKRKYDDAVKEIGWFLEGDFTKRTIDLGNGFFREMEYSNVDCPVHDLNDPLEKDGPQYGPPPERERLSGTRRVPKAIPPHLQAEIDGIIAERENVVRYARSNEAFQGLNMNSDASIADCFERLMVDHQEAEIGGLSGKLKKVAMSKHPVTAIMMNAGDRQPRTMADGETIRVHTLESSRKPASFYDRTKALVQEASELGKKGDYTAIKKLFSFGKAGDRLLMDTAFFPAHYLMGSKDTDKVLGEASRTNSRFREYAGRFGREGIPSVKDIQDNHKQHDSDLSGRLADDDAFLVSFGNAIPGGIEAHEDIGKHRRQIRKSRKEMTNTYDQIFANENNDALDKELDFRHLKKAGVKVAGAGAQVPAEYLEELVGEQPKLATRIKQFNSIVAGKGVASAEDMIRSGGNFIRSVPHALSVGATEAWKDINFWTPQQLLKGVTEVYQQIADLSDFYTQVGAYDLLRYQFKGTLIGSQFEKAYQAKEDERVNQFKDSFNDWGNQEVVQKLYTAKDMFELKAVLIEGFQERGCITLDDLLDNRFIKNLNYYAVNNSVPTNYSEQEMQEVREVRHAQLKKIRDVIDEIWGDGQYQQWKNASTEKYNSVRQQSMENFKGNTGPEKEVIYKKWWELLRTPKGIQELKNIHPGELVGSIEEDMNIGRLDSGQTWGLLQSMICAGVLKIDHLARILTDHANDMPVYCLLEPNQARLCGLTAHWEKYKHYPYNKLENPFINYFRGRGTLPLKVMRFEGKWMFLKTQKEFDEAEAEGKITETYLDAQEAQKFREVQPEYYRKWDNCCTHLGTAYSWSQLEGAMMPNTQGDIDARPHDMVAQYRGIHDRFTGAMATLLDSSRPMTQQQFDQTCYAAYDNIAKTCAYAGFLNRQAGKTTDFNVNKDGSPKFNDREYRHTETRAQQGRTNFQRMILDNEGPTQRMNESSKYMDMVPINDRLRIAFKTMAGYQHVPSLGIDPATGKQNNGGYTHYDHHRYQPDQFYKEVIRAFLENVEEAAAARRAKGEDIVVNIANSGISEFDAKNKDRVDKLHHWKMNVAKVT